MSQSSSNTKTLVLSEKAQIFAALGDETRLKLVTRLADGEAHSITQLAEGFPLTRQAITKHLRVLEGVGLVHSVKTGRESQFQLDPKPMDDLKVYIAEVSKRWDDHLDRLKNFLESSD
ncbi:MAG: helix-turn-helix transcriptional regulator [Chitinophagaceae bacterium]|nr:helix-turn-helix transcriptional regulator [Oligoflexus sp.]